MLKSRLFLPACVALASLLVLDSCRISGRKVDFSIAEDHFTRAQLDDVVIESNVGASTPAAPTTDPALTSSVAAADVPPLHPAPAAKGKAVYTVKKGDTLNRIARQYNTTAPAIVAANGLRSPLITIGQKLTIPAGGTSAAPHAAAAKGGRSYAVQKGDTLNAIAARHRVTPQALMQANRLTPATAGRLRIGQKLLIPSAR